MSFVNRGHLLHIQVSFRYSLEHFHVGIKLWALKDKILQNYKKINIIIVGYVLFIEYCGSVVSLRRILKPQTYKHHDNTKARTTVSRARYSNIYCIYNL